MRPFHSDDAAQRRRGAAVDDKSKRLGYIRSGAIASGLIVMGILVPLLILYATLDILRSAAASLLGEMPTAGGRA